MEITNGLAKAIESTIFQHHHKIDVLYVCRYKGKILGDEFRIFTYKTETGAKTFIRGLVKAMFHHCKYWQNYKENIKSQTGYNVDYTAIIEMKNSIENINQLTKAIIDSKIITIDKLYLSSPLDSMEGLSKFKGGVSFSSKYGDFRRTFTGDWNNIEDFMKSLGK